MVALPQHEPPPPPAGSDLALKARLKQSGLRITSVRLGVLQVLSRAKGGLDAQQVFDELNSSTTDRVTVYRTLNSLVEKRLAHRVDPGDRVYRFSLSASTDAAHAHEADHPHFVCDSCGTVQCVDDADVVISPRTPHTARSPASGARRFKVTPQNVTLHGVCEDCDDEPTSPTPPRSPPPTPASRPASTSARSPAPAPRRNSRSKGKR